MTTPVTEMVKLNSLYPDPKNPRTISANEFEALQRSIDQFGFVEPIVANKQGSIIIGGHQRWRAAQALGITLVPVVWVDLDEAHQHALNIALNKISGEFDNDILAELLTELDDDLLSLTGFDDKELETLTGDPFNEDGEVKDDKPKDKKYTLDQLRTLAKGIYPKEADTILDFLAVVEKASE